MEQRPSPPTFHRTPPGRRCTRFFAVARISQARIISPRHPGIGSRTAQLTRTWFHIRIIYFVLELIADDKDPWDAARQPNGEVPSRATINPSLKHSCAPFYLHADGGSDFLTHFGQSVNNVCTRMVASSRASRWITSRRFIIPMKRPPSSTTGSSRKPLCSIKQDGVPEVRMGGCGGRDWVGQIARPRAERLLSGQEARQPGERRNALLIRNRPADNIRLSEQSTSRPSPSAKIGTTATSCSAIR